MLPLTLTLTLASPPAVACGGLFCDTSTTTRVDQAGERIVFAIDDSGSVEMHAQIEYEGAAADFAWIVPVPVPPTVFLSTDALFDDLASTAPAFRLDQTTEGRCSRRSLGCGAIGESDKSSDDSWDTFGSDTDGGVRVAAEKRVGPYDTVTLQADDAATLRTWLTDHDYELPPTLDTALAPYIADGSWFVALRMANDATAGELAPLGLTWEGGASIPLTLTAVAAMPDMPVTVWVFGDGLAVPAGYARVAPNPVRYDWLNGAANYTEVVGDAIDAAGGQAFVVETSLDTSDLRTTLLQFDRETVAAALTDTADPAEFRAALTELGFVEADDGDDTGPWRSDGLTRAELANLTGALNSCITIPEGLQTALDDDGTSLWDCPTCWEVFWQDLAFDPATCAAAVDDRIVRPRERAHALFDHPRVTRLLTMLSPEEMTSDPGFTLLADGDVIATTRQATEVTECTPAKGSSGSPRRLELDAFEIALPSDEWWNSEDMDWATWIGDLPAAQQIWSYDAAGNETLDVDHTEAIGTALVDLAREADTKVGGTSAAASCATGGGATLPLLVLLMGLPTRRRIHPTQENA